MRHGEVITGDGARIAFVAAGERQDEWVVLVHGSGASAGQFRREVTAYADEFATVAVSLRGHGGSSAPAGATVADFAVRRLAGDVEAVLDHLGVARAHVVGNSLGGLVGFELLAAAPERVASLVTFGTAAALAMPRVAPAVILGVARLLGRRGLAVVVSSQALRGTAREQVRRDLGKADLRAVAMIGRHIARYDYLAMLRQRRVPWLLVRGGRDRSINRRLGSTLDAATTNPDFRLADLPKAGHYANLDDPKGFDAAVRPFLGGVTKQENPAEAADLRVLAGDRQPAEPSPPDRPPSSPVPGRLRPSSRQETLMREPAPTLADALEAVRGDPAARFAALLAAAFAFSAAFALGFVLGTQTAAHEAGPTSGDAAQPGA